MVSARMAKNSTWNETSRWMRWLATGAGILGGVTCVMSGIFMSVTHLIDPKVFQTYCKVNSTFVGPYRLPTDAATWLLVFRFWSDILVQKRQFCPACHSKNGYNQILAQRCYLLWVSISKFLVSSDWKLFILVFQCFPSFFWLHLHQCRLSEPLLCRLQLVHSMV